MPWTTRCILAIDTASPSPGVSVWTGEHAFDEALPAERQASERLLSTIEACLRHAGIELAACDRIAACSGPGSFTGVRVGLATAWGLARALGRDLEPVSTLEVLAECARETRGASVVSAAMDAGRGEVVWQPFDLSNDRARPVTEAKRTTASGAAEEALRFGPPAPFVCVPTGLLGDTAAVPGIEVLAPAEPLARVLARTVARRPLPRPSGQRVEALSAFYARPSAAQEKHGGP